MKNILALFLWATSITAFAQQQTITLFNGTNLDGWYAFDATNGKEPNAEELFLVQDGMIKLMGSKPGYIMTEKSFQNFKLTAEYRWNLDTTIVAASKKKNSGLMYLVPETTVDELWPKGIQFQIKEGATGDFVLLKEVTLKVKNEVNGPGASVAVKRIADAEKPFGEWNQLEVISKDGHIIQKLNGVVVNEGTESLVQSGRILLQYEGYPIDFKSIVIVQ